MGGGRGGAHERAVERGSVHRARRTPARRGPLLAWQCRGVRGRPSQGRPAVPRGSCQCRRRPPTEGSQRGRACERPPAAARGPGGSRRARPGCRHLRRGGGRPDDGDRGAATARLGRRADRRTGMESSSRTRPGARATHGARADRGQRDIRARRGPDVGRRVHAGVRALRLSPRPIRGTRRGERAALDPRPALLGRVPRGPVGRGGSARPGGDRDGRPGRPGAAAPRRTRGARTRSSRPRRRGRRASRR
jgi:hypothetical protein